MSRPWSRECATGVLGADATEWTRDLIATQQQSHEPLHAYTLDDEVILKTADAVVQTVGEKRSTWRHWNLWAEASRQTIGTRFATAADRESLTRRIVATAEQQSVRLTPPEAAHTPPQRRRADGSSMLRPRYGDVFTSTELLAAETRLRDLATSRTAPAIENCLVRQP